MKQGILLTGLALLAVAAQANDVAAPDELAGVINDAPHHALAEQLNLRPQWKFVEDVKPAKERAADTAENETGSGAKKPHLQRTMPDSWPSEKTDSIRIVAIDVAASKSYVAEIDKAMLERFGELALTHGLNAPSQTNAADLGDTPDSTRTWSNGVDTRTRRAVADGYSNANWPYRTIGRLSNNCTGTLVGPRHVLTAAHCIWKQAGGSSGTKYATFSPRRGGNSAPWGDWKPIWYWVPAQYYDGSCNSTGNCNKYDIGIIVLEKWTRPSHPGWMGYGSAPASSLNQWNFYMRGYPSCNGASAPSNPGGGCTSRTLYGDTQTCDFGSYFSPDSSGWSREVRFDCDGSPGQSGSALYTYNSGLNGPAVFGEYSQYACTGVNCVGNTYPNTMTRLTPAYRNVVTWFRDQCPSKLSNCSF